MQLFDLFLRGLFFLMGAGIVAAGLFGFKAGSISSRKGQASRLREALGLSEEELAEAFRPVNNAGYRLVRHIFNSAVIAMGAVLIMDGFLLDPSAGRFPNAFVGGVTILSITVLMAGVGLFYLLFRDAFSREMTLSNPKTFEADRLRSAKMSPLEKRFGGLLERLMYGLFLLISMLWMLYAFAPDVLSSLADLPHILRLKVPGLLRPLDALSEIAFLS